MKSIVEMFYFERSLFAASSTESIMQFDVLSGLDQKPQLFSDSPGLSKIENIVLFHRQVQPSGLFLYYNNFFSSFVLNESLCSF